MDYTKWILHAASYATGAVMVAAGGLVQLGFSLPGVSIDNPKTVVATGAGIIAAAVKGDQAKAAAGAIVAFLIGGWLLASPAEAANLSPALKAPVAAPAACTAQRCVGLFAGVSIANAGGNMDIIGSGQWRIARRGVRLRVLERPDLRRALRARRR